MASPKRPRRRPVRRSRRGGVGAGVAAIGVLVVGIALGVWWTRPPERPDLRVALAEKALADDPSSAHTDATGTEPSPEPTRSNGSLVGADSGLGASSSEPDVSKTAAEGEIEDSPYSDVDIDLERDTNASPDATGAGESVSPEELALHPLAGVEPAAPGTRIALVIDDLGRSVRHVEVLAALGVPLTYAVLPFEIRTDKVVAELQSRGLEIFCHLPMEADGGANPGPGALMLAMSEDELREGTLRALEAVPGAVGVNNHMGSGVSASREAMRPILEALAAQEIDFLDSRTSPRTVAYEEARQLGIPTGERDVFLDVERDPVFVHRQFEEFLEVARRRGSAIAIAHPYKVTFEALEVLVPRARELGFEFVVVRELLGT